MDQSTYNNIYRNASPMTPSTPSNNTFQTNVNRTKTRKWVEAKKQNYAGDDWGNEFDDDEEPEDDPPGPAQQPATFRPLGQGAQLPGSQMSGNRAFSQPTAAFGHFRGQSFGRNPSGPPALHVQTQQSSAPAQRFEPVEPFPAVDQSSFDGAPDYRNSENVTSPQSGRPRPFGAAGAGYPGRQEYSPATQDRGITSPASATGLSSRFPPRKSSMGHQDAPTYRDTSRNRSGSRPGSSGRPWPEQRSDSPGQQAPSAATGAPNKPLPFIRPAEIYRRMEEEKEKERRSMESAGRPSLDGIQSPGSERSTSPAYALRSPVEQRRRLSFDRDGDENLDSVRGLKTTLPPVAERRSEYGLDHLINEHKAPAPTQTSANAESSIPQQATTSGPLAGAAPQSGGSQLLGDPRRKSISPRLPDLARMSGFGPDFFSGSSGGFSDGDRSAQATPPEHKLATPNDEHMQTVTGLGLSSAVTGPSETITEDSDEKAAPSLIEGPVLAEQKEESSNPDTSLLEPQPAASDEATIKAQPRPSRPSIPGGWVSESTNIASEVPTPMERPEPTISQLATVKDTAEEPATIGGEADDIEPTTVIKQAQPLENDAPAVIDSKDVQQDNDNFGTTVGQHDQAIADEVLTTAPAALATSKALPPLQTPDPLTASSQTETVDQQPQAPGSGSPSYGESPSKYSTSTHPLTATTSSGFSPTAPLNPQRGGASDSDFIAPGPLARNLTMSSMDNASPHESDKLREDIIKSLSPLPIDTPSFPPMPPTADRSLTTPASDIARESRYLSGVYDEYMGFPEDKSLQGFNQEKDEMTVVSPAPLQSSSPARTVVPSEPAADAAENNLTRTSERGPRLSRRFSWEELSENVTPNEQPQIQTDANVHVPDGPTSDATEPQITTSPDLREDTASPTLQLEPQKDGEISHTVSMISNNAPGGLGVSGIEPPSPISVLSSPRPVESTGSRLSLADEKVLLQASSHPVSPNLDSEHPALSRTPPESPAPENDTLVAPPPKPVNITSWREILSLPTPALRIERFEEARSQYLAMDSGLSNWMEHMKASSEDPALQPSSTSPTHQGPGSAQTSPTGPPAASQQPYYQQYLNASNPNVMAGAPGPARQRSMSQQQQASGFGTSKNQAAVKSKEFLHAAGAFGNKATKAGMKSGMKLFNRGKDKLRGSGDKSFQ
ncbi:hypothetical protein PFICI_07057 [Pestalotiopsis fici W106-1]|uniref:Uncharacterized protein n=1 Tax=Pestalotiopsis fici (strain W106-1 / CGMCC3.15140) TaxID=1229662 RepID=W3X7M4_PESFW|nr:uncharacterized protein PFICI_07057 [Pestalotiopsis fici W106-1]ETS82055.1 hypothetical protein PFICI_07057 [Pestalotiopsis fici W106-1]